MAIDKGIMRRALLRARRLNKKQGYFSSSELGVYQGGMKRMLAYNIITKNNDENGGYKLVDPKVDPVTLYMNIVAEKRHGPRHHGGLSAKNKVMADGNEKAQRVGPMVRITPYGETEVLIQIDRRLYLAHEVVLTTRGSQYTVKGVKPNV
jgi:hypothetical protein